MRNNKILKKVQILIISVCIIATSFNTITYAQSSELMEVTKFTVDNITSKSTSIIGKGLSGATVKAYVGSKQIGKDTKVSAYGNYKITIPALK